MIIKTCASLFLLVLLVPQSQRSIVRGLVSDELGGVIVGATVTLTNEQGQAQTTVSDANGNYRFNGVAPGNYSIAAIQMGFSTFQQNSITVVAGRSRTLNVTLKVAALQSQVTVDPGATVNTDPTSNKSALVLKGNDLNALSDDPDELAAELSALAGPAAGPSGTQVYVDGFTAGPTLPDKRSRWLRAALVTTTSYTSFKSSTARC